MDLLTWKNKKQFQQSHSLTRSSEINTGIYCKHNKATVDTRWDGCGALGGATVVTATTKSFFKYTDYFSAVITPHFCWSGTKAGFVGTVSIKQGSGFRACVRSFYCKSTAASLFSTTFDKGILCEELLRLN